jgi:hypothetical protein
MQQTLAMERTILMPCLNGAETLAVCGAEESNRFTIRDSLVQCLRAGVKRR